MGTQSCAAAREFHCCYDRPSMASVRRLLASLMLSAAAITVLLLLLEAATRLFARVGPTLIVKDPRLGKRYVAGYDDLVYVPEGHRTVRLRFQRDGFRGPDRPYALPAHTRRIAVIGDSMTVAVATDEERTFVRLLEDRLNQGGGETRWEVLNFGVSSASTGQELVVYREVAARYRPQTVVCAFYVGNDIADNSARLTRAARLYFDLDAEGRLRLASSGPAPSPMADWLDQHSRFYVWQKVRVAALRARGRAGRGVLDPGYRAFQADVNADLAHAWLITEKLLVAFRDEARARGAVLVLAIIPCAEQVADDVWQELLDRAPQLALDRELPERRLIAIAKRAGIPVVPMAAAFRRATQDAAAQGRASDLFLNHRHHLNDEGHRVAADLLWRGLVGLGVGAEEQGPGR
jgi:lysophospholipase L1-like esterase